MGESVQARAVRLAARLVGGTAGLAAYLEVSPKEVSRWIGGEAEVPRRIFLKTVDVISDDLSPVQRHAIATARAIARTWALEKARGSELSS